MKRKSKKPPTAIQRVNKMLSRIEMATSLEFQADGDQDMLDLAKLLRSNDPQTARCSPHTLAQKIGLPYSRIIEAFKQTKRMETVVAVAQHMPLIGEGIARDAMNREVPCATCFGSGEIGVEQQTRACIPCEGTGRLIKSGDPVARKQALEMMGLAGQHAVPILATNSNILINNGSLEDTLRQAKKGLTNGAHRDASTIEGGATGLGEDSSGPGDHRPA